MSKRRCPEDLYDQINARLFGYQRLWVLWGAAPDVYDPGMPRQFPPSLKQDPAVRFQSSSVEARSYV
jgi:hypothetical protein